MARNHVYRMGLIRNSPKSNAAQQGDLFLMGGGGGQSCNNLVLTLIS